MSSIQSRLSHPSSRTAAIIGAGSACRVYPDIVPQGVQMPFVAVSLVGSTAEGTQDKSSDMDRAELELACVASTRIQANALRRAVRLDLSDVALAGEEICGDFHEMDGFSETTEANVSLLFASAYHDPSAV